MDLSRIENLLNGVGELKKPESEKQDFNELVIEVSDKIHKNMILADELKSKLSELYRVMCRKGSPLNSNIFFKSHHKYSPTSNTLYEVFHIIFSLSKRLMNSTLVVRRDSHILSFFGPYWHDSILFTRNSKPTYELGVNKLGEYVKFTFYKTMLYKDDLEQFSHLMDLLRLEMERAINNFEEDSFMYFSSFVEKYSVDVEED